MILSKGFSVHCKVASLPSPTWCRHRLISGGLTCSNTTLVCLWRLSELVITYALLVSGWTELTCLKKKKKAWNSYWIFYFLFFFSSSCSFFSRKIDFSFWFCSVFRARGIYFLSLLFLACLGPEVCRLVVYFSSGHCEYLFFLLSPMWYPLHLFSKH